MAEFNVSPSAYNDLRTIWRFIAQDNPLAASNVINAAFATFATLADSPRIGKPYRSKNPRLKSMRTWPVSGYPSYAVFYRPFQTGVEINRVYHTARDIDVLLHDE